MNERIAKTIDGKTLKELEIGPKPNSYIVYHVAGIPWCSVNQTEVFHNLCNEDDVMLIEELSGYYADELNAYRALEKRIVEHLDFVFENLHRVRSEMEEKENAATNS